MERRLLQTYVYNRARIAKRMAPTSIKQLDYSPQQKPHPSPADWRDQVIYHLLIDRFDNNQSDSPPSAPPSAPEQSSAPAARFLGGKIPGITRRLDYLRGLGCTTIWISPPFKNRQHSVESYHGYAIQNLLEIDPRFGTLEELKELIRQAHQRDMYVIIDIVINHTGDNWSYAEAESPVYNQGQRFEFGYWRGADGNQTESRPEEFGPDDAVWPIEFQDPDFYKRQGRIGDPVSAGDEEMISGDTGGLKDLDLTREDVRNAVICCYKWWIAQTDCDGFRLDTVKHCEPSAVSTFVNAMREYAQSIGKLNFLIFAEIVEDDQALTNYIGLNIVQNPSDKFEYPMLSACLDFPLYFQLADVIQGKSSPRALAERYSWFQHYFRDFGRAGSYYVTFIDNHDQIGRFYFRFLHGDADPKLAVLGAGYLLTAMGIPCIYYGTEQCLDGGGAESDEYVRETMFGSPWGGLGIEQGHLFNEQHPAYKGIAAIARIRASQPALRYGRQYFQQVSLDGENFFDADQPGQLFAFSRVLDTSAIVIVLNVRREGCNCFVALDDKFFAPDIELINLLTGQRVRAQLSHGQLCMPMQLQPRDIAIVTRR